MRAVNCRTRQNATRQILDQFHRKAAIVFPTFFDSPNQLLQLERSKIDRWAIVPNLIKVDSHRMQASGVKWALKNRFQLILKCLYT